MDEQFLVTRELYWDHSGGNFRELIFEDCTDSATNCPIPCNILVLFFGGAVNIQLLFEHKNYKAIELFFNALSRAKVNSNFLFAELSLIGFDLVGNLSKY